MSRKANIVILEESMDQKQIVRLLNANFKSLARSTDQNLQNITGKTAPTHHIALLGRDALDQHPIKAISGLASWIDATTQSLSKLSSDIEKIENDIKEINIKLENHEERIKKLEEQ